MRTVFFILGLLVVSHTIQAQMETNPLARNGRFSRGTGSDMLYRSFVIPLDFQKGVELDPMGTNSAKFGNLPPAELPWFMRIAKTTAYHISVTGTAPSEVATYPLAMENPIVSFGSAGGGAPLYTGQSYTFAVQSGGQYAFNAVPNELRFRIFLKDEFAGSNVGILFNGQDLIALPRIGTPEWEDFIGKGILLEKILFPTATHNGKSLALKVSVRTTPAINIDQNFGSKNPYSLIITLQASSDEGNFLVGYIGGTSINTGQNKWVTVSDAINPDSNGAVQPLFTVDFQDAPAWRSTFISQPHFAGKPLPAFYQGRSLEELLATSAPVTKQFPAPTASHLLLDNSPELRTHPILDQLVLDLESDPIALATYVLNEIELTDALSYNDDGSIAEQSINLGGVNRGALGTLLEKQGSPTEQCALLIYLLRKANVPATYVYPPNNGLKMLDQQMSKLLRLQLKGAVDGNGNSNIPQFIPVNYPWVAAYVNVDGVNQWVHLFPWLKDTEIKEGLTINNYLPEGFRSGFEWVEKFLQRDSQIFSTLPTANFQQSSEPDKLVVIEAEKFYNTIDRAGRYWKPVNFADYSGLGGLQALPNGSPSVDTGYAANSPRADYKINFTETGVHYVWIRGIWTADADNSLHIGLNGVESASSDRLSRSLYSNVHEWSRDTMDGVVASINVPTVGVHTINLWMREDGMIVDKILLTKNPAYVPPNSAEPKESVQDLLADDTVSVLFPKFAEAKIKLNHPKLSLEDMGVKIRNRPQNPLRWVDFPQPWEVSETGGMLTQKTNLASEPTMFDTMTVEVFSDRNNNAVWDSGEPRLQTGELRTLDLHNRRFLLRHEKTGVNTHNMILSLAPYRQGVTGQGSFGSSDPDLLKKQLLSTALTTSDDNLYWVTTYLRHRSFSPTTGKPFLQLSHTKTVVEKRPLRKGDTAALCLNFGRVTADMVKLHADEFWRNERLLKENPDLVGDPEVFQGTAAYLMGMGYYEKVSDFNSQLNGWFKNHAISFFAHGFAKLSPRRNPDGSLPNNGDLDLVSPSVDMSFQRLAYISNGTLHPDSAQPLIYANSDFLSLLITETSAQEHRSINRFLNQSNSASTISLLHLAQQQGGSLLELSKSTYLTQGAVTYTTGGETKTLSAWCGPSLWNSIISAFNAWDGDYVIVYITPGPVWAANGSYRGIGALVVSKEGAGAYITGHLAPLNGGYGSSFASNTFSTQNFSNFTLQNTQVNTYALNVYPPSLAAPVYSPPASSLWGYSSTFSNLSSGSFLSTPTYLQSLNTTASFHNLSVPITPVQQARAFSLTSNLGATSPPSWFANAATFVSDPVDVTTGAFYHDAVDLQLNGPMPLSIRRNYNSLDQGDHAFGWGWKLSTVPYLILSEDGQRIQAAEMDGSVIQYKQQSANPNLWLPTSADNPQLHNRNQGSSGGLGNALNAKIEKSSSGSSPLYTLTGADGSLRSYLVKSFPAYVGTSPIGLTARYFDNVDLTNQKLVRTDATVNFNYGTSSPDPLIDPDTFSVRWTGQLLAPVTGTYTFKTLSNDGVRLWVNGTQLINKWQDQGATAWTGTITLTAGQRYDLKLEYYDNTGTAQIALSWSYPGQAEQLIPSTALFAETNGLTRERPYLTRWEDSSGNYYDFQFGTDIQKPDYGQLNRIRSSNGSFLQFLYDQFGHITEAFTHDGRRLSYHYDEFGDLVRVILPDNSVHRYEYQHSTQLVGNRLAPYSKHLLTREIKPEGRILENDYDSERRVTVQRATVGISSTVPVQNASFTYTNTTQPDKTLTGSTTVFDAYTRPTVHTYVNSLITEITDPNTNSILQEWYAPSDTSTGAYPRSLKRTVDKRGLQTTYLYDARGNPNEVKHLGDLTGDGVSDLALTSTLYNLRNQPELMTDPLGRTTHYFYTNSSYPYLPTLVEHRAPDGTVITRTAQTYTAVGTAVPFARGLLETSTRAAGTGDEALSSMTYNNRGFLLSLTQPTGTADPAVTFTYRSNLRGERVEKKDAALRTWTYSYDPMGRLTGEEVRNESNQLLSWNYQYYNLNGELEWRDGPRYGPEDYVWQKYDGAGRPTETLLWRSQMKADGSAVETPTGDAFYASTFKKYNLFGDLTEITDPYRNASVMIYDAIGRLLTRKQYEGSPTDTLLTTESFQYEQGDQVSVYTNPLGGVTKKFYTAAGQLRRLENPDGSIQSWLYDLTGRPVRETRPNASYWQTVYDDAARTQTRILKNSSNTVLAAESKLVDRRGNCTSQTGREGHTVTQTFDDLDRIKTVVGPAGTPASAQQTTTTFYDASGKVHRTQNGLGEETETTFDALQRPLVTKIKNASGTSVRQSSFTYAPDHHSRTQTEGTGGTAISTTVYTDTQDQVILTRNGLNQKWITSHFLSPRARLQRDPLNQTTREAFDARGLLTHQILPDHFGRIFSYDAAGNLLEQRLPAGLTHFRTYDLASRLQTERLQNGALISRQFSYDYYPSGAWVGQLKTVTDPRGMVQTFTYDDFLRKAQVTTTNAGPHPGVNLSYGYDKRNLLTQLDQSYTNPSFGPPSTVQRNFDAYGQIGAETVSIGGSTARSFTQKWNAAGRRSELLTPDSSLTAALYQFTHRADGLLSQNLIHGQAHTFTYGDNGLLIQRSHGLQAQTVTSRDAAGRVKTQNQSVSGAAVLGETLNWRADGSLDDYSAVRSGAGGWNETRDYNYTLRGQLTQETFAPTSGTTATLSYEQDPYGLNIRIRATTGAAHLQEVSTIDTLGRVLTEQTNTAKRSFTATGQAVGALSLEVFLDGMKLPQVTYGGWKSSGAWSALVEAYPGEHTLSGQAKHPSGAYTATGSSSFTLAGVTQSLTSGYDAVGHVTSRTWSMGGKNQTLTWDNLGRLIKVTERNGINNGYDWSAVFDGFGRRLQTTHTPVTANVPITAQSTQVQSWFDPQVEFLEVGVAVNGVKSWKGLGSDVCGTYGGCMGIGGLESVVPETGAATGIINDYFGNSVASVQSGVTTWNATKVGGYGALPSNTAKPLSSTIGLAQASGWRGKVIDPTGFYYWGARPYDPQSGRFLSPDPAGHSSSMTLYDYAGNDPINRLDADGRIATTYGTKAIGYFDQGSGPNANAYFQHTYNTEIQNQASTAYWSQFSGTERGLRQNVPGVQNGMMAVDSLAQGNYQRAGQYSLAAGLDVGLAAATMRVVAPAQTPQAASRVMPSVGRAPEFTKVTSWASEGIKPDLNSGRWVQLGEATPLNFWKTGLPGPKGFLQTETPYLRFEGSKVPFSNSITDTVPTSSLQWPSGLDTWRGFFGQRRITE